MACYLVTGGAGFIGSNFIRHVLNKYEHLRVINVDKLTYAGNLENLRDIENMPNYRFVRADICDYTAMKAIFDQADVDWVVNFAAESHVDRSIDDPDPFVRTNVLGTATLLRAAYDTWYQNGGFSPYKRFLQVSTDEVYGSLGPQGLFTEETPLAPRSPYSASKAAADLFAFSYFESFGLPVMITRCSNNYGPYQFPEKLIPLLINNCLNKEPLPIYGDGLNIRDWLHAEDHVRALDLVLHTGAPGQVYNIGGGNERTNIQITAAVIAQLREKTGDCEINESLLRFVTDRKGHDRRYAIDASKLRRELGWEPERSFEQGLSETLDWYLENRDWMQGVTSGQYREYYQKMYQNR